MSAHSCGLTEPDALAEAADAAEDAADDAAEAAVLAPVAEAPAAAASAATATAEVTADDAAAAEEPARSTVCVPTVPGHATFTTDCVFTKTLQSITSDLLTKAVSHRCPGPKFPRKVQSTSSKQPKSWMHTSFHDRQINARDAWPLHAVHALNREDEGAYQLQQQLLLLRWRQWWRRRRLRRQRRQMPIRLQRLQQHWLRKLRWW